MCPCAAVLITACCCCGCSFTLNPRTLFALHFLLLLLLLLLIIAPDCCGRFIHLSGVPFSVSLSLLLPVLGNWIKYLLLLPQWLYLVVPLQLLTSCCFNLSYVRWIWSDTDHSPLCRLFISTKNWRTSWLTDFWWWRQWWWWWWKVSEIASK